HFLGVHELGAQDGGVGDVGHDYDDVARPAVFSANGTKIDGELGAGAVAAHARQIEVIDLLAAGHGCQRFTERGAARGGAQVGKGMPQDLVLLKAKTAPAPVGITDYAVDVSYQNQALGMAEDLAGEITLLLQLGLRLVEAGDIEDEAAVVQGAASGIAHRKTVHEHVDGRSILAPQDFFVIAHFTPAIKHFREFLPLLRRKINLRRNVQLKDFVAGAIAKDPNQRVVNFDEA